MGGDGYNEAEATLAPEATDTVTSPLLFGKLATASTDTVPLALYADRSLQALVAYLEHAVSLQGIST